MSDFGNKVAFRPVSSFVTTEESSVSCKGMKCLHTEADEIMQSTGKKKIGQLSARALGNFMLCSALALLSAAVQNTGTDLHSLRGWPVIEHSTESVGLLIMNSATTVFPFTLGLLFMNCICREGSGTGTQDRSSSYYMTRLFSMHKH